LGRVGRGGWGRGEGGGDYIEHNDYVHSFRFHLTGHI
jgi:hypothetical protein